MQCKQMPPNLKEIMVIMKILLASPSSEYTHTHKQTHTPTKVFTCHDVYQCEIEQITIEN